jgi:hypothetical protein
MHCSRWGVLWRWLLGDGESWTSMHTAIEYK